MLRIPKTPGLVKSQKFVLLFDFDEKATCWKVMRAMKPVRKMRKINKYMKVPLTSCRKNLAYSRKMLWTRSERE
jgi:hypothetical protein